MNLRASLLGSTAAVFFLALNARAQATSILWEPNARYKNLESDVTRVFKGHRGRVASIAISPDGRFALSGSEDQTVKYWDIREGKLLRTLNGEGHYSPSIAFSPDGKQAIEGNFDHAIRIWDLSSGKVLKTISTPEDCPVSGIAVTPDGRSIISGCYRGRLLAWDAATGALLWEQSARSTHEMTVRITPDGHHALTVPQIGGEAQLWETSTGKLARRYPLGSDGIFHSGASISPDGRHFLVTEQHSELQHWEILTGNRIAKLESEGSAMHTVAYLPNGRQAVTGGQMASSPLFLWDIATRKLLGTMEGHTESVASLAVTPNGRFALSGGADKMVRRSMISAAKGGLDLFSDLAGMTLEQALAEHAGERPTAPILSQGKYESTSEFQARVSKAQMEFESQAGEYNKKVEAFPAERKGEIIRNAFFSVFGRPKVSTTRYDPDSQIFSLEVAGTGKFAADLLFRLTLKDLVPRDQAEKFEDQARKADPRLEFVLDSGRLSLKEAALVVRGKAHAAVPAEEALQKSLAQVNLGSLEKNLLQATELTVELAENPELARKARELEVLRKKKAQAEEVKRLESEIERLQRETGKTYTSDVDEPGDSFPERPHDFAVVVGIARYDKLPDAEFADRDAQAMAKQLKALGVPEQNLIALSGKDATLAKLAGYLEEWLPKNATPDSRVYFYFSGHGAPDPQSGEAYLAPWDADASFLKSTAFPLQRLYSGLGALKSREVLLVLDACFSGAGGRSVLAKGTRPLVMRKEDPPVSAPNITLFAASAGEEITGSLESQGHGLFTYHFLKALRRSPQRASALYNELRPKVESAANRQNRIQTPLFRGPDIQIP